MIVDFMGCWVIEVVCKYLFADLEPKPMVTKGRERREQRRLIEEQEKAQNQDEGSKLKVQ
jgi:manganese-transporting P-type ATPase